MEAKSKRGSERLMAAWKARALTEESVREIATALEKSPATVERAAFNGSNASGLSLSLAYDGDDVPLCGNDLQFWLRWHRIHGGNPPPPRVIINGTPILDSVRLELGFGNVEQGFGTADVAGAVRGGGG
jgi:hypothetical protein